MNYNHDPPASRRRPSLEKDNKETQSSGRQPVAAATPTRQPVSAPTTTAATPVVPLRRSARSQELRNKLREKEAQLVALRQKTMLSMPTSSSPPASPSPSGSASTSTSASRSISMRKRPSTQMSTAMEETSQENNNQKNIQETNAEETTNATSNRNDSAASKNEENKSMSNSNNSRDSSSSHYLETMKRLRRMTAEKRANLARYRRRFAQEPTTSVPSPSVHVAAPTATVGI